MSVAKWSVGVMLILVLASLALALSGRKSVRAELVIPASPASIWSVLMDTSGYRDWNPIFVSAQGVLKEGGTISYQMKIGDSPAVGKVSQHEEYRGLYVWFWDPSPVERAYTQALVALRDRLDAQRRE